MQQDFEGFNGSVCSIGISTSRDRFLVFSAPKMPVTKVMMYLLQAGSFLSNEVGGNEALEDDG